jgi:hypothetical protein
MGKTNEKNHYKDVCVGVNIAYVESDNLQVDVLLAGSLQVDVLLACRQTAS